MALGIGSAMAVVGYRYCCHLFSSSSVMLHMLFGNCRKPNRWRANTCRCIPVMVYGGNLIVLNLPHLWRVNLLTTNYQNYLCHITLNKPLCQKNTSATTGT